MKKLIATVAMTLCLMVIGVTVYAACSPGSLKSGTPGTCTSAEPTYGMNGTEYKFIYGPGNDFIIIEIAIGQWEPGESWCDLSTIGNSCWVSVFPE